MTADPLEAVRGRIDLDRVPFTDRLSRLLVFAERERDSLWIGLAAYEAPASERVAVRRLRPTLAGAPLSATFSARPDRVDIATPAGDFRLAFADPETLVVRVPPGETGITFELPHGGHAPVERPDRAFIGGDTERWLSWRGVASTARTGPNGHPRVSLRPDDLNAGLIAIRISDVAASPWPAVADALERADARWRAWFSRIPAVPEPMRDMALHAWWVLAANQILPGSDPRRAGVAPSKIGYVGIWNWDACFHALGLRHGDPEAAKDQLRIILAHQLPDGMLPDVIHDAGVLASTADLPPAEQGFGLPAGWDPAMAIPLIKPPLLAWAARAIWEIDGDSAFLREVYAPIVAAHEWWLRTADPDGNGLFAFNHPFSSGLDDSPLWDGGPPVESPELSAYLALQCDELAAIAEILGHPAESTRWKEQAGRLTRALVEHRWNARAGLFASTRHGRAIPVATPFGLMPLLTGGLPAAVARRLVASLHDERRFWPRFPVPTVALDEPAFDPNRMWRGPVWLNINRLLVEGLRRSGFAAEAAQLRQQTLGLAMQHADFREYYNPLTGIAPERAAPMFSWAAASYLDLAMAEVSRG